MPGSEAVEGFNRQTAYLG